MNKKIFLTLFLISSTQASFDIHIPLIQSQGGALPDNSISIGSKEVAPSPDDGWESYGLIIKSFSLVGDLYDCSDWSPSLDTTPTTQNVNQNSSCKQNREGFKQEYYFNNDTGEELYFGPLVPFTDFVFSNKRRTVAGTAESCTTISDTSGRWTDINRFVSGGMGQYAAGDLLYRELVWNNNVIFSVSSGDKAINSYELNGYKYVKGGLATSYLYSYQSTDDSYNNNYFICRVKL